MSGRVWRPHCLNLKPDKLLQIDRSVTLSSNFAQGDAMPVPTGMAATAVPSRTLRPFGEYPNVLGVTAEMQFSPVVKFPLRADSKGMRMIDKYDYVVRDLTGAGPDGVDLVLDDGRRVPQLLPTREEAIEFAKAQRAALLRGNGGGYDVGRYDEDRRGMYTSELFAAPDEEEWRTVHVGIDIGAPVGTAVHAFEDGIVHSAGYNPQVGDYGNVVVVKHFLGGAGPKCPAAVYALYGHLGASGMDDNVPGRKVAKGQVIGEIGDCAENGGWTGSHVHFQLSTAEPATHDMPGTVSRSDREEALLIYPDPRYVLGELY